MDPRGLVDQLLALSDDAEQQAFLESHRDSLSRAVAAELKARADQFLRADIQRALQVAALLGVMAEVSHDPSQRALALLAEANARSIGLGEYRRAIELYEEAADLYAGQGLAVEQARSQIGKIGSLANLGRYDEALESGRWAAGVLEAHTEWGALATLTMNLAIMHARQGEDARALELFDRAGELYRKLGDEGEAGWLWVQLNRAFVLRNLGRFSESLQASEHASKRLAELGQRVAAARASQNMALTYFVLGRYNEALEQLDQVRDVYLADGRRRDAMLVELFVTDCLLQLRRFNDVLEKCRRVRALFHELGAQRVVAQAIVNEAVAYAELARYPEALESLAEAREIFEREDNRVWVASTDLEKAAVLLRQGRLEESLATAEGCAAVFARHELPVEEAQSRLAAARAAVALGRRDRAHELVVEALEVGEGRDVPTLKYQGHQLLGAMAAAGGDLERALGDYDRAIEEVERLRGRLMVEYRVGFLEDKEGLYADAVRFCLELDRPHRGMEYAERAKSRALLDMLAYRLDLSVQARDEADQPLVEKLVRLRAERDRLYRRWESDGESGERGWTASVGERGQAQREVLTLERQITELWHRLLIRNADYAREAALWTVHVESPKPYLDPDVALVEYFIARGELLAFVVTADDVQARRLAGDLAGLQTQMQLLWLNLRAAPKTDPDRLPALTANVQGLLSRLYAQTFEPLAEVLAPFKKLILVPHGLLHYLPFHALYDGKAYLLERYEISYLPGSSFLRYCQEAQSTASDSFSVGHSNGGRLPYALQEARAVATLLGAQPLLEERATLSEVQRVAVDCRALHVAAHGDFRPDNPLFSGLALADGWLTTLEVFNLRLRASLVTLSACQTGRNVVGGGDELLGLMRAFLGAGAATLVLSLWAVEDRSTARLMEMFYAGLAQGRDKGASLRQAQRRFLQPRDGDGVEEIYAHPYYWAPFFLVGGSGPL